MFEIFNNTPAVIANNDEKKKIRSETRSFKSNENIRKKEDGSYYLNKIRMENVL